MAIKDSHMHMVFIAILAVIIILMIVHISKMNKAEHYANDKFDLLGSSTAASTAIMDSVLEFSGPTEEHARMIEVVGRDGINLLQNNANNMIGPINTTEKFSLGGNYAPCDRTKPWTCVDETF